MNTRLKEKTVIVTGAARGIGASIVTCTAREGAHVMATDVDGRGGELTASLRQEGLSVEFHLLDVRDGSGWCELVAKTLECRGRIDGLVNNAALQIKHEPLQTPESEWELCMDVNLLGVWRGCRAVLPAMLNQGGGSIVNIGSVHGHQIIPGGFPYSVSKHGVIGITRALGVEYAPRGVRVNAISPGYVDTEPAAWSENPGALAAIRALVPARRLARPDEVAMTAVFLLSDEAPFITATTISIDGGRMALFHE